jgi:hypothetical protein
MRFGAQVRAGPTLLGAIERAHELGADVVQIFQELPPGSFSTPAVTAVPASTPASIRSPAR